MITVAAQEDKLESERVLVVKEEVTKALKRMEPREIINAITSVSVNRQKAEYEISIKMPAAMGEEFTCCTYCKSIVMTFDNYCQYCGRPSRKQNLFSRFT